MKRILVCIAIASMVTGAVGMSSYFRVFKSTYGVQSSSRLGKAQCLVCHRSTGSKKLNAYGRDVRRALGGKRTLTSSILGMIERLDSAGSGKTNIQKIHADQLPGVK